MLKNQKDHVKRSSMELGIKEERDGADMEEEKSDGSSFGAGPIISGGHQTTADQQNLFRIEQLLTRNGNSIKEPQLYSKDIAI